MESVKIKTSQNVDIDYPVASIGDRILAYLLDSLIMIVFMVGAGFTAVYLDADTTIAVIIGVVIFILYLFYDLFFEIATQGKSPGKMVLGIKVVKIDGSQPTILSYILRWVLRLFDITLFSGFFAVGVILLNGKGQRLGDIAAKTTVVKMRQDVSLNDTILVSVEDSYKPIFKEAEHLDDETAQIIKDALDFQWKSNNIAKGEIILDKAKKALEEKMNVESTMAPLDFLRTILKDYNHINGKV